MNQCVDCGAPTTGVRCRQHHSDNLRRRHLADTLQTDVMILEMVGEGASSGDVANRLGISRSRAADKIIVAKERMAKRQELNLPVQLEAV